MTATAATTPPPGDTSDLVRALVRMSIVSAHQHVQLTPLAGGVSSDIYRADLPAGVVCVKRALPRLKVVADWRVPVDRNRYEVAWLREAGRIVPTAVPAILGEDDEAGAFAMAWLPPEQFPVWKSLLGAGGATVAMAAAVGDVLGRIHAATADRADLAARFATDALFHAIRLDPYLVATAQAHPDLSGRLLELVAFTAATRRVLVHGDYSPKNILIGADGPVIIDAECAWYGDPAFDLAFVLNHLLLKGLWQPGLRDSLLSMFDALVARYRAHVRWEPWPELEARTAALLPGLLLARIDGKSPVEYLTDDAQRETVRRVARFHLVTPTKTLEQLGDAWQHA